MFFNEESQGRFEINHETGDCLLGHWQIPYKVGSLKALAYDDTGCVIAVDEKHSFGEAKTICLRGDKQELKADGQDLLFITVSMKDEKGKSVENANNRIFVRTSGSGRLAGIDNGDSTDKEEYKGTTRRLFSGKLMVAAIAGTEPGEFTIFVTSPGMEEVRLTVPVLPAEKPEGVSADAYFVQEEGIGDLESSLQTDVPVRNIKLTSDRGTELTPDNKAVVVTALLCPEHASDRNLIWNVVNDAGIPSELAEITENGNQILLTAKSDGNFRVRCMSKCGTEAVRILSSLEFSVKGLGETFLNPYAFICAGLYDYSKGEVGNGNEHGVATARDGETWFGFHNIDFGNYGSDEITIPVFALTDEPYRIRIYKGMPFEDHAELAADVIYQKPSIWNTYQEETYRLNHRFKGVTSLCFVLENKVHIKGFSFTRQNRAFEKLKVTVCDELYGDTFLKMGDEIRGIGNNVSILFHHMEFGEIGVNSLTICGYTPNDTNTIQVRFISEEKEEAQLVEFWHMEETGARTYELNRVKGTQTVAFVFLPGSNFDFCWFQFGHQADLNRNM